MDAHTNFAYGTVLTAPSPAASGTSLVLNAGQGALMPAVPFNAVVWPTGQQPTASNAEIVRVTNVSGDTLTITREQESTGARTILAGDQFGANITVKTLTDVEDAISVVSQALSVETASRVAGDNALSAAISVVSNALSVETAARVAKDDALSQAVSVVSQAISVVSQAASHALSVALAAGALALAADVHASTASAAATSADIHAAAASAAATSVDTRLNTLSNLHSVLSQNVSTLSHALSVLSQQNSVEHAALSVRIDLGGGTASVTSTELSAVSAQAKSAIDVVSNKASAVSHALSVLSNQNSVEHAALSVRIDGAGGGGSVTSTEVSAVSAQAASAINVVSNAVSIVSVAAAAADTHAGTASAAATSVDARLNTVSSKSASTSVQGLQSVVNALSHRVSVLEATPPGSASVTSTELSNALSVVSAAAASANNAVSAQAASANNVLSQQISALSGTFRFISNPSGITVSSATLITISGLSVTIEPSTVYRLKAHLLYLTSAGNPVGFGIATSNSFPVGNGRVQGDLSINAGGDAFSTSRIAAGWWNNLSFGSIMFSATTGAAVVHGVIFEGLIATSAGMASAQTLHAMAKASTGTGGVIVASGSYLELHKLS